MTDIRNYEYKVADRSRRRTLAVIGWFIVLELAVLVYLVWRLFQ